MYSKCTFITNQASDWKGRVRHSSKANSSAKLWRQIKPGHAANSKKLNTFSSQVTICFDSSLTSNLPLFGICLKHKPAFDQSQVQPDTEKVVMFIQKNVFLLPFPDRISESCIHRTKLLCIIVGL